MYIINVEKTIARIDQMIHDNNAQLDQKLESMRLAREAERKREEEKRKAEAEAKKKQDEELGYEVEEDILNADDNTTSLRPAKHDSPTTDSNKPRPAQQYYDEEENIF